MVQLINIKTIYHHSTYISPASPFPTYCHCDAKIFDAPLAKCERGKCSDLFAIKGSELLGEQQKHT